MKDLGHSYTLEHLKLNTMAQKKDVWLFVSSVSFSSSSMLGDKSMLQGCISFTILRQYLPGTFLKFSTYMLHGILSIFYEF